MSRASALLEAEKDSFFSDTKHGKAIKKILNNKWDEKKVRDYLDSLGDTMGDSQYDRFLNKLAHDLRVAKADTKGDRVIDFENAIVTKMKSVFM